MCSGKHSGQMQLFVCVCVCVLKSQHLALYVMSEHVSWTSCCPLLPPSPPIFVKYKCHLCGTFLSKYGNINSIPFIFKPTSLF